MIVTKVYWTYRSMLNDRMKMEQNGYKFITSEIECHRLGLVSGYIYLMLAVVTFGLSLLVWRAGDKHIVTYEKE